MPVINIPWNGLTFPTFPITITPHGHVGSRKRIRVKLNLNTPVNFLNTEIIKELNLLKMGEAEIGNGELRPFYYVDLLLVSGLLGYLPDRHKYRGVIVYESKTVENLEVGSDLIRRGLLVINRDLISLSF